MRLLSYVSDEWFGMVSNFRGISCIRMGRLCFEWSKVTLDELTLHGRDRDFDVVEVSSEFLDIDNTSQNSKCHKAPVQNGVNFNIILASTPWLPLAPYAQDPFGNHGSMSL